MTTNTWLPKFYKITDMPAGTRLCQILTGDKVRRKCSEVVNPNLDDLTATIWRMIRACVQDDGAGLAAPQIGVYKRIFVVQVEPGVFRAYINPNFVPVGTAKAPQVEGCLSVPGKRIVVKRYTQIKATWNEVWESGLVPQSEELEGWDARVFQHEKDHLDGVTILDKR